MRRRGRWESVVLLAVFSCAAAYGCGTITDDPLGPKPLDEDASGDATFTPPDGAPIPNDGAPIPNDGAPQPDATSDAGADAEVDAGVDAEVDAGYDAGVVEPPGPLSPTYVDYEINHLLTVGQSNSIASDSQPRWTLPAGETLITVQPYTNLMFNTGVMTSYPCNGTGCPNGTYVAPTSFVPLVETDRFFSGGANDNVNTVSSSMANLVTYIAMNTYEFGARAGYPATHDVLVSNHGRSGLTYWCLRKNGCNYNNPGGNLNAFTEGLMQVTAAKNLAAGLAVPKSHVVRGVTVIHGESDQYGYSDNGNNHPEYPLIGTNGVAGRIQEYDDGLIEWQEDYEAGIKAITGQVQPIPLFVAGVSGYTRANANVRSELKVAHYQLRAHERAPGKVVLVAPGYVFDFAYQGSPLTPQCRHYSVIGQKHLGEYFAKAYAQVVFKGQPWEPVRPIEITRAANVVTVKYLVPKPPLVIDTMRVAQPTHTVGKYGFDFFDGATPIAITSVAVVGDDTVQITLASTPVNANKRLSYANEQPFPGCTGPGIKHGGGARGNLRDSDDQVSLQGYELFNWGVTFDKAVP
ncbi:MAG: hypothetical protein KF819_31700 [Labilithrix sp.]|nr:hypothetical protein [Labilithrix sp.]